jgi:hypothetical protein
MCLSAQLVCNTPVSQNSQEVTKSISLNLRLHDLQKSAPTSRLDNGFNQASRHITTTNFCIENAKH